VLTTNVLGGHGKKERVFALESEEVRSAWGNAFLACREGKLEARVAVCCSVLQYVAACCMVVQCVAVWCSGV